jgi:hypothetical protein
MNNHAYRILIKTDISNTINMQAFLENCVPTNKIEIISMEKLGAPDENAPAPYREKFEKGESVIVAENGLEKYKSMGGKIGVVLRHCAEDDTHVVEFPAADINNERAFDVWGIPTPLLSLHKDGVQDNLKTE